jgi:hypothetical protein
MLEGHSTTRCNLTDSRAHSKVDASPEERGHVLSRITVFLVVCCGSQCAIYGSGACAGCGYQKMVDGIGVHREECVLDRRISTSI